jgi:inositol-phosphate phosphatase / L-galactose 1-phosphate phosphatase / histidinol-phosphatase
LQATINIVREKMLPLAHHMVDAAENILRNHYRAPVMIDHKTDNSPVTRADREAEAAIRALIETHFPEHGIVGEEMGNVREDAPFQWVIDPIDGTRGFIAGYPLFTTLIALLHQGEPLLGMINQPIIRERWVGMAQEASALNFKTISSRDCRALKDAVIATTSTDYFTDTQANAFAALRKQAANTVLGGDAYAYAMLASGHIDIVVDADMKPYDFCALKPVIEGAGGVITDWKGKPLTLSSDGTVVAAATKELHEAVLVLLG